MLCVLMQTCHTVLQCFGIINKHSYINLVNTLSVQFVILLVLNWLRHTGWCVTVINVQHFTVRRTVIKRFFGTLHCVLQPNESSSDFSLQMTPLSKLINLQFMWPMLLQCENQQFAFCGRQKCKSSVR